MFFYIDFFCRKRYNIQNTLTKEEIHHDKRTKKHLDIQEIGIPIIGAGEYEFPFELAFEIAITSTWNALLEWKQQDEEIKTRYQNYFQKERKIAFQSSAPEQQAAQFALLHVHLLTTLEMSYTSPHFTARLHFSDSFLQSRYKCILEIIFTI